VLGGVENVLIAMALVALAVGDTHRSVAVAPESRNPKIESESKVTRWIRPDSDRSMPLDRVQRVDGPADNDDCGDGTCDAVHGEHFRNCPDDCSSLDDRADLLRNELKLAAFTVDEGSFEIFETRDCETLDHCWANNPTSPYAFFLVPLGDGEFDPDPEGRSPHGPGMRSIFRLQPDEALVFVGTTPPPSPYFSFTAYVFNRFDPGRGGDPPYGDRIETFASLGDSLNHLTLNTADGTADVPFNAETVVIVTGDRGVDASLRRLLATAGFPDSMVNTVVIPRFEADGVTPLARMGYENEDDVFNVLVRIANPDALEAGSDIRAWLDDPGGRVFRVRRRRPHALEPFAFPPLRPQGTGIAEDPIPLNWLVRGIEDRYLALCTRTMISIPAPFEDGYFCLDTLMPCFADCRDTPYLFGTFKLGPPPEAIIVAGQNHERTGKASYVNVTVTRISDATAFYSIVLRDLESSADLYISDRPDKDEVWQVKLSRDCREEPFCYEVSEGQVPTDEWFNIILRAYLEPATRTSPIARPVRSAEIVFPRFIKVNCAPR